MNRLAAVAVFLVGVACHSEPKSAPGADETSAHTKWVDLLSDVRAGKFLGRATRADLPGELWMETKPPMWTVSSGVMRATTVPETKWTTIACTGEDDLWRDFVFECELTIHAGAPVLHFRITKEHFEGMPSIPLVGDEAGPRLAFDRSYVVTVRVIGDSVEAVVPAADWKLSRKLEASQVSRGEIGIALPPGTHVEITKMRIKVLP